jgi:histone-lysine N-methyltransferase SETMAR
MKDVLLLRDNARPHTSLRTHEAIAKMRWTILPHPAHSPDLALTDYHLFGPVTDALCGRHFADGNELKYNFRNLLRIRGS